MTRFLRALLVLAAALVLGVGAPASAAPVRAQHLGADLVAETTSAAPGSTIWVALVQDIDPHWHTYWRNPGDAGEATTLKWTLPAGWTAGDFVWATPERLPVGPIMNYGYEGRVLLPVPVQVPASARPGETATLKAAASFLVCADVCVPADATLTLTLPIAAGTPQPDPEWGGAIAAALAAAPKPQGLKAAFQVSPGALKLAIAGAPLRGLSDPDAYFYPYDDKLIDHGKPEAIDRGPEGLTFTATPGYDFTGGKAPTLAAGVLVAGGKAYEVIAPAGPSPPGASGLGPPAKPSTLGLPLALAFAFLGGLILNLMPCVFPVLSMKAAALAGHAGEAPAARRQGLAFLGGVLVAFLGLAGLLIAARAGGAAVGWGFQLQSPPVVAGLALVMFAAALNLSGLYEIGTSIQGLGAGFAARGGLVGSAFTGVLAVVVAAPCTAPFMAGALGFALTQGEPVALAVFAALGLGFAAPFVLLSFSPALIRRLPRPGTWMETFRKTLAFPMYAAAAWLVWVLDRQSGDLGLARILAAGLVLAFAAWVYGAAQRRRAAGGRAIAGLAVSAVALMLAIGVVAAGGYGAPAHADAAEPDSPAAGVPAQAWSPDKVAALQAAGKPVFVNFTAAWCVTCQVNEKVAFSTGEVADAFRRTGSVYLVADWTNRDAVIAKALADHGRVGVPLYLVYGAGGGEPKVLPQLLTPAIVADALKGAAPLSSPPSPGS
ncbi:MAG TPA: protein-disulfide reductase DsbD domain-containing protein [Caulobacteraceae bacterium]|nr:protein-disulfide reductase DsbD domain-containing protein [Caulobacteraceae bacterium]